MERSGLGSGSRRLLLWLMAGVGFASACLREARPPQNTIPVPEMSYAGNPLLVAELMKRCFPTDAGPWTIPHEGCNYVCENSRVWPRLPDGSPCPLVVPDPAIVRAWEFQRRCEEDPDAGYLKWDEGACRFRCRLNSLWIEHQDGGHCPLLEGLPTSPPPAF